MHINIVLFTINGEPPLSIITSNYMLISEIICSCFYPFCVQVFNAQQAGYVGAIVYNDQGDILTTMSGSVCKYPYSDKLPH